MKRFNNGFNNGYNNDGYNEENDTHNNWLHVSNLIAALFAVLVLLFVYGFLKYADFSKQTGKTDTTPGTAQENTEKAGGTDMGAAEQLKERQMEIKQLVEVRKKIIDEIIKKTSDLKLNLDIDMNTGAVRFSEALFFETNSEKINSKGKEYLKKFVPAYLSILLGETGRAYLDQIIIEGHADDGGSYVYNLGLSQRRAYVVASHIFNNKLTAVAGIADPEKYISISGRSYSRPVIVNGTVDRDKSRRVEFKFKLKDEELIGKISSILERID